MKNDIFNNIYNPDVLSTIANLSNDEVFTPPELVNKMLDTLPNNIWSNPDIKFLDPATKSGVFLREITKRLIDGLEEEMPDLQKRIDHILQNQVYGLALTELTSLMSRRTLYGTKYPNSKLSFSLFDNVEGNIYFKNKAHTWRKGKCIYCNGSQLVYDRGDSHDKHAYEFIHLESEDIKKMKFDVIIGNPHTNSKQVGHSDKLYLYIISLLNKQKN